MAAPRETEAIAHFRREVEVPRGRDMLQVRGRRGRRTSSRDEPGLQDRPRRRSRRVRTQAAAQGSPVVPRPRGPGLRHPQQGRRGLPEDRGGGGVAGGVGRVRVRRHGGRRRHRVGDGREQGAGRAGRGLLQRGAGAQRPRAQRRERADAGRRPDVGGGGAGHRGRVPGHRVHRRPPPGAGADDSGSGARTHEHSFRRAGRRCRPRTSTGLPSASGSCCRSRAARAAPRRRRRCRSRRWPP